MIVISDTTPILALLKANQLNLLNKLYEYVTIPESVYRELIDNPVFEHEKEEIINAPFLKVERVRNQETVEILRNVTGLDAGESEALVLYGEKKADLLLIDEHKGRGVAKKMSVDHIGTIGILMVSYDKSILTAKEVEECLEKLMNNGIRLSKNLCSKVLNYVGLDCKL